MGVSDTDESRFCVEEETAVHLVTECFGVVSQKLCFGQATWSLFEDVPATVFHQISVTGRLAVEDVIETALLEGTIDLKVGVKCNFFLTVNYKPLLLSSRVMVYLCE